MDAATILNFINQTIKKTKTKELNWLTLKNSSSIKPLPESSTLPSLRSIESLITSDSYIASYKTGELTFLVFSSSANLLLSAPPYGCTLSLRMQDNKSKYAVEICNSKQNPDAATQLMRLYNLIAKDSSSVSALINDFLNS